MKKSLSVFLRFGVSAAALGGIVYGLRGKLSEAFLILRNDVAWEFFLMALAAYLIGVTFLAKRIQLIFKVQNISLKFHEVFYLNFIGLFFNFFFPSAVGGDIAKVYYASKHSGNKIGATTSVILDRLFGFITIMVMALVAVTLYGSELDVRQIKPIIYSFWGVMAFSVIFFSSRRFAQKFKFIKNILPAHKLGQALSDIYHSIYMYRNRLPVLGGCILISFIAQTFFISIYYFVARSLDLNLSIGIYFILVPIITIVSMVPSLGGLGVREAGSIYFFSSFMSSEMALALSLLVVIVIYGYGLVGGIAYAFGGGIKEEPITELEDFDAQSS